MLKWCFIFRFLFVVDSSKIVYQSKSIICLSILPSHWCHWRRMFSWPDSLSVCNDRTLFVLCTTWRRTVSRLPDRTCTQVSHCHRDVRLSARWRRHFVMLKLKKRKKSNNCNINIDFIAWLSHLEFRQIRFEQMSNRRNKYCQTIKVRNENQCINQNQLRKLNYLIIFTFRFHDSTAMKKKKEKRECKENTFCEKWERKETLCILISLIFSCDSVFLLCTIACSSCSIIAVTHNKNNRWLLFLISIDSIGWF